MNITNLEKSINPNPNPTRNGEHEDDDHEGMKAMRLSNALSFPMVLKAALEIGAIDAISSAGEGAWLSPSEVACRLPTSSTNPQAPLLLDRMLRLLASYSVLKCRTVRTREDVTESVYATEPVCQFFSTHNHQESGSLVPLFMLLHSDVFIKTWSHLKYMILDGRDAFTSAHGTRLFQHLGRDEPFHDLFQEAMTGHSIMSMKKALESYKGFEGVNVLVDVGGGVGTALGIITSKYPNIRGINFDLANVIAGAPSYPRVEHVAGDMFVEVPKGEAIFMKVKSHFHWILHDWNDDDCSKILGSCWKALPDKGKVIIVDTIVPENTQECGNMYSNVAFDWDMLMLSACSGAKERTRAEFKALATRSGFSRCDFICRVFHCWVIEFHKET